MNNRMDKPDAVEKGEAVKTLRKEMIALLEISPLSARDLSQALKLREKLVYDHLVHIEKTVRAKGRKLIILPARCESCGFVFSERGRFTRPGRCPKCKNSHIRAPAYQIRK